MSATPALRDARQASGERIRRWIAHDLPGMAELLDDALVYVHSTGQAHDKAQLLEFLERKLRVAAVERQPGLAIEQDGLACLVFTQSMRAQLAHPPWTEIESRTCFTELWRRQDGGQPWRLVHAQSTVID